MCTRGKGDITPLLSESCAGTKLRAGSSERLAWGLLPTEEEIQALFLSIRDATTQHTRLTEMLVVCSPTHRSYNTSKGGLPCTAVSVDHQVPVVILTAKQAQGPQAEVVGENALIPASARRLGLLRTRTCNSADQASPGCQARCWLPASPGGKADSAEALACLLMRHRTNSLPRRCFSPSRCYSTFFS